MTAADQEIAIPNVLLDVLRWHVDTQLAPNRKGGPRVTPRTWHAPSRKVSK